MYINGEEFLSGIWGILCVRYKASPYDIPTRGGASTLERDRLFSVLGQLLEL